MIGIGLSGHFDLAVVNAKTGVVRERRSFDNVILNTGLDKFFTGDFNSPCPALGVGTSEPLPTDTGLASSVYEGSYIYQSSGYPNVLAPSAPDWVSVLRLGWRIPANAAVGTFTEIGIKGWGPNSPYWCRALIKDDAGAISALTILPDEYLDVVYACRYHPDLSDRTFSFQMNGNTYNCVSRPAFIAGTRLSSLDGSPGMIYSYSGSGRGRMLATQTLGDITDGPTGTAVNSILHNTRTVQAYEPGTYTRKVLFHWGLDRANVDGGIGSIVIDEGNPRATTQISFTPKIPKDATNELTLVFALRVYRWEGSTP